MVKQLRCDVFSISDQIIMPYYVLSVVWSNVATVHGLVY